MPTPGDQWLLLRPEMVYSVPCTVYFWKAEQKLGPHWRLGYEAMNCSCRLLAMRRYDWIEDRSRGPLYSLYLRPLTAVSSAILQPVAIDTPSAKWILHSLISLINLSYTDRPALRSCHDRSLRWRLSSQPISLPSPLINHGIGSRTRSR